MKKLKNIFARRERLMTVIILTVLLGGCWAYEHFTGRVMDVMVCNHVGSGITVCSK